MHAMKGPYNGLDASFPAIYTPGKFSHLLPHHLTILPSLTP